jgi:hypothetical protein
MPAQLISRPWGCPETLPSCRRNILFVGAERPDEFAHAMRLVCQGHTVTVVNPRQTNPARAFRAAGGRFIRARIENIPRRLGPFHIICENYPYPYPSALDYAATKAYAFARLAKVAVRGRWVVFTESPRLAAALGAVAQHEAVVRRRFRLWFTELSSVLAPRSAYLRRRTRYRLIFQRVR